MKKLNLIGSGPTLEKLLDAISNRYFYSECFAEAIGPKLWALRNQKGPIEGFVIRQKGNRFRFESLEKGAK